MWEVFDNTDSLSAKHFQEKIGVNYIPEKVKKSTVLETEWNTIIVESKTNMEDVKLDILDILGCTDLKNVLIEEPWRNIYRLNKNISQHLLSTISNKFWKEEKRYIIKLEIKNILKTNYEMTDNIIILFRNKQIFIIDIWKKLKNI